MPGACLSGARSSSNTADPTAVTAARVATCGWNASTTSTRSSTIATASTSRPRAAAAAWARTAPARGEDVVIKVPPGTEVLAEDQETMLADLMQPGDRGALAKGGNGGFGNAHFKSVDQPGAAPRQPGPARRGADHLVAAEADRRRRHHRAAQRRQVHLPGDGERAPSRRSPTIPSRRCIPISAWSKRRRAISCWPTFRA